MSAESVERLRSWVEEHAFPRLHRYAPELAAVEERELARLIQLSRLCKEPFTICFLGSSGVGKSTLLNALIGGKQIILPQGGLGPLTAQAIQVRYSPRPYFRAEYLPASQLEQLAALLS